MKLILGSIAAVMLLTACVKPSLSQEQSNNSEFQIELLFEYNGIKMYRFRDNGKFHYFTKDATITHQECGKNCSYEEQIKTQ